MRDWVRTVLERYGQNVTVERGGARVLSRAFCQPAEERSEQVPGDFTGIGWLDGRLWLYLGQTKVEPGDLLFWNGFTFRVRSSRPYYIGEEPLYWWAAMERAREAAECGS